MSDFGDDEPEQKRATRRKKIPFTKRRKHPVTTKKHIDATDLAYFDSLTDDVLIKLMCDMDIDTLFTISSLNKRVNAIFRSPWFFRRCMSRHLSPKQRMAALVRGHNTVFKHITEDENSKDLDIYEMTADGVTIDGVQYSVKWSMNMHNYAYYMSEYYEREDEEEYGTPPKREPERLAWFKATFAGKADYAYGKATFQFPEDLNETVFVREHVRDVLLYFTMKFSRYMLDSDAQLSDGDDDLWNIEVIIRPFGITIEREARDGKKAVDLIEKTMKADDDARKKKIEGMLKGMRTAEEEKESSAYTSKLIDYSVRQLKADLNRMRTNPRQIDDPRLSKMCDATVEEARELLEKIRLGARDEATIDSIKRVHSRLLECIE